MFAVGGFFAAAALVLPHPSGSNVRGVGVVASIAIIVAVLLGVAARGVPSALLHVALDGGTLLISAAIYFWGPGEIASAVALLYVWVTLYAFYFFPGRAAVAHATVAALAYAVTLSLQRGHDAVVSQWVVTVGTAVVAGVIIGRLGQEIRRTARTDSLTGIANRRWWFEVAANEHARATRRSGALAVALIDLDEFKGINDLHGHAFGDRLLREICAAWSRELRPGDLLGRYGGDEFVVLLPDCSLEDASLVAGRIITAPGGCACTVAVSEWHAGESIQELLLRADTALYAGKRAGGARVVAV